MITVMGWFRASARISLVAGAGFQAMCRSRVLLGL